MLFYIYGMLQTSLIFLICFCINISEAQRENHPKTLKEEILTTCPICTLNEHEFKQIGSNDFHNAHAYFYINDIDTSFDLVSKLIERQKYKKLQFNLILYALKGKILREKKLYGASLKNLNLAIAAGELCNSRYVPTLHTSIAEIYIIQESYQKAVKILEDWKSNAPVESINASTNFHNLGLCYILLKEYDKAEENLLMAYQLNNKAKDTLGLAESFLDIANLYYTQYKDDLAFPYFVKGLAFAKRANDLDVLSNAHFNLSVVHENKKEFEKALEHRKAYEKIQDSIWNRDKIFQLAQNDKGIAIAVKEEILKAEILKKQLYSMLTGFF
ncbi:tetratricopeptide repeat protein [Flavivirga aquimarina]|uniref:Tetratricopeptide repeat protein n=1 Tax=Flavivirga aquimarina TaxID=2027862 RepID=A0ABT8WBK4_9FLAO|nr:tetratricopeptide repeat protein [Flavivirga aquimarina]MDO5970518.1 tetratricopeptide repeat protein [Flavivirga aquimarina]